MKDVIDWVGRNWESISTILALLAAVLRLWVRTRALGNALESVVKGVHLSEAKDVKRDIERVSCVRGTEKTLGPVVDRVKGRYRPADIARELQHLAR